MFTFFLRVLFQAWFWLFSLRIFGVKDSLDAIQWNTRLVAYLLDLMLSSYAKALYSCGRWILLFLLAVLIIVSISAIGFKASCNTLISKFDLQQDSDVLCSFFQATCWIYYWGSCKKKNLLLQVYIVQWEFHRLRILQCRQIVVGGCKVNCSIHGRCTLTSTMESQVITFNMPFLRLSVISNSIATISIYIFRYTWACNFCCKSRSSNYVVLLIYYVLNVTNTYLGNAYTMVQPRDANYVLHPQLCIGLSGYS